MGTVGSSWQWRILFLMIFCWNLCSTTTDYELLDSEELLPTTTSEPLPYFDDHANLTNITYPLGSTAFLQCRVNLLKDKTCRSLLNMYQRIAAQGKVDRLRFREILQTTFDITDDVMLDRVYRVFDSKNDGVVDEAEWVEGLGIILRGTPDMLIDFCYFTYDINGDKSLAREELHHCLRGSIYPYSGILNNDEIDEAVREIVEIAMRKLDVDKVSWLKKEGSEVRLLTFGLHTYSGDERLSINFEQPNNWKLRIQTAERHDQGEYQCQVSSHPPIILHVSLMILVPRISIVDDLGKSITDKFYNAGSTLELRCIISHFHFPDAYSVLWRQGNKTLNYDASRGGISVKTTVNKKEGATSVLYIANAKKNDSGPYMCSLVTPTTQLTQIMIYVHVINGDVPAAMQHSAAVSTSIFCFEVIMPILSILLVPLLLLPSHPPNVPAVRIAGNSM